MDNGLFIYCMLISALGGFMFGAFWGWERREKILKRKNKLLDTSQEIDRALFLTWIRENYQPLAPNQNEWIRTDGNKTVTRTKDLYVEFLTTKSPL